MDEPWKPADATDRIREMARSPAFSIAYKIHATKREEERGLYASDVLHILKTGFVYDPPLPATRAGYFRYVIQGPTPNTGGRQAGLVVIPDYKNCTIKICEIVTVMWVDERSTRAGTILGE